ITINDESKILLEESVPYQEGWLQIRSVGGVRGPIESLWNATIRALEEHPKTCKSSILNKYSKVSVESDSELLNSWKALFEDIAP
ncbi:hypothetical protein, partial [Serratia marcescens]|uniref:hypothetical protein n=1 Tax=Serratia marcescens TaxID=615 RepID=UPI001953272C